MNKEYAAMNEYDKILLEHQFALDNDYEDRKAKNDIENKKMYLDKGEAVPEHLLSENFIKCSHLRYMAFEDTKNKLWLFYDSDNDKFLQVPFGQITMDILNNFKIYHDKNPIYDKYISKNIKQGASIELLNTMKDIAHTCKDKIDYLFLFLSQFEDLKKKYSKAQFTLYVMELWKQYRHCYFAHIWKDFVECENPQHYFDFCEKAGIELSEEEKQEHIEATKKEFQENLSMLNKIVNEGICIYHDTMPFTSNNELVVGRAFCLEESNYIFSVFHWDLFHVLTEAVAMPHICARCGQLYLSNNNKAKYCSDCKADSNKIRNENRKANSCRYLHKKILDKLSYVGNSYEANKEDFRIESNYYWDIVKGKTPKQIPAKYDSKIKTEKQYLKWLENYLK